VHYAEITIFKLQPSPVPHIFFGWDDTLPGQRQLKNLNRRIQAQGSVSAGENHHTFLVDHKKRLRLRHYFCMSILFSGMGNQCLQGINEEEMTLL